MKMYIRLLCYSLLFMPLLHNNVFAVPIPKNNATFLQDSTYKATQSAYQAALNQAQKVLDKKSFAELKKDLEAMIKENAQTSVDSGVSPEEAWIDAYDVAEDYAKSEVRFEFLRKNPVLAQGYYNAENGYDGYLLMEKQKGSKEYALEFSLVQKGGAFNSGNLRAFTKATGKKDVLQIFAEDINDGTIVGEIQIQGDTLMVTTTEEFKSSAYLGHGVFLDGKYLREKK